MIGSAKQEVAAFQIRHCPVNLQRYSINLSSEESSR
jgi:hypothetical protein